MMLRVRLLSMTLLMVAIVALTLIALSSHILASNSTDMAWRSSDYAGGQVLSFIQRRLTESPPDPSNWADAKRFWTDELGHDTDLTALLEQTMAQSNSIVEIDVAAENGAIIASSNPQQIGKTMAAKKDLYALDKASSPVSRIITIMTSHEDYEVRKTLGLAGQQTPLFTIQVLVSSVLLRDAAVPSLRLLGILSSGAMIIAFVVAYWSANIAMRPLTRISHLIDEITSGKAPASHALNKADAARELVMIESKLSLLGERFRDARQDASQLRINLEGALEKLDAGTRQQLEGQIALARRLTAINSLTGRVAHEIKNPLNAISLRLEMLRARIAEEVPESEPEFAILSEEVTRLDRVVRTFLDFNRPVDLVLGDVNVVDVAAEILNLLEPEATQKGIEISLEHPSGSMPNDGVIIKADADLVRQALLNIAVNAIEAMDKGGRLRIVVEKSVDTCTIRIQDTGPGIPREQRDKIFQLYYTTKTRGSGIGLAMTFRAVQLHGGTIEVEGEAGKGTTFRVTLPLAGVKRAA